PLGHAVVVELDIDLTRTSRFDGQVEESLGVGRPEVLSTETVDAANAERPVLGIALKGRADLMGHSSAVSAVRIGTVADHKGLEIAASLADFLDREGPDEVGADDARLDALLPQLV